MSKHTPPVEKMIAKVMKKKDLKESDAIEYMLTVATGRLAALWRYDDSLPEGKKAKGVRVAGKRKPAERAPALRFGVEASKSKAAKPKKSAPKKAAEQPAAAE